MDLFLIISFPFAFIIHDAEEIFVQHQWVLTHKDGLIRRFPKAKHIVHHLSGLTTKAFTIAVIEEFVLLIFATVYAIARGPFGAELWIALFMAFAIHFFVHIVQWLVIRSYTPGLATSIMMLPYAYYVISAICATTPCGKLAMLSVIGIVLMIANLIFAHWLGYRFKEKRA